MAKLEYFTHLDFPEIRGVPFPFLSYLLGWGRVMSLWFDQIIHRPCPYWSTLPQWLRDDARPVASNCGERGRGRGDFRCSWPPAPRQTFGDFSKRPTLYTVYTPGKLTNDRLQKQPGMKIGLGLSPCPVTVTTWIFFFLWSGNPYKPSFPTDTGRGDNPSISYYKMVIFQLTIFVFSGG